MCSKANRFFLLILVVLFSSFTAIDKKPRIFLIGDSTMANKLASAYPETGWGMIFPKFIQTEVYNFAVNGRSTKSFRTLGHWATVLEQLQPGDWVFIQFGHNDQKVSDTSRYADAQTDYRKNLVRYIEEIRVKGANPLLITPVMRRKFDAQNKFVDQHGEYPAVVKSVASKMKVPLIDLHAKSEAEIVRHGVETSKHMFLGYKAADFQDQVKGTEDNTHFSPYGAAVIASLVAEGIRESNTALAQYLTQLPFEGKFAYELPKVMDVRFRIDTFNILSYGAKADGMTLNSDAIQKAIEACNQKGGGTVVIPKGLWLTGPITLKNNVNLNLQKGAVLQFSKNPDDYPLIKTNWEGVDAIRCKSPINGENLENIAITGEGIIDGAGEAWRPVKKNKLSPPEWEYLIASGGFLNDKKDMWYPTARALKGSVSKRPGVVAEGYDFKKAEEVKEFLRPNMVSLTRCKRVLLEGVTFQNSPAWCLHPLLNEHITLRNLTVRNPWYAQNGDGVDVESCGNVLIENCTYDVGDDAICIKSGRDEEGRKRGVPTEDVVIRNCTVFHGHGGFVIGSEMSGGARNIFVSDCNFLGTDVGLRFKTTRGRGGIVERIYVDNIRMSNISGAAILFDMYYMAKDPLTMFAGEDKPAIEFQPVTAATPQFRDFHIRNVVCKGAETAIFVRGLPEMNIKDIRMEDILIESTKGFVCVEGENITLHNSSIQCNDSTVVSVQNGKNITLDGINYEVNKTFMNIAGERSKSIRILNTDINSTSEKIEIGAEVPKNVLVKLK